MFSVLESVIFAGFLEPNIAKLVDMCEISVEVGKAFSIRTLAFNI